jgi:hypothetical protein
VLIQIVKYTISGPRLPVATPVAVNLTAYLFRFRSCCSSKSFLMEVWWEALENTVE